MARQTFNVNLSLDRIHCFDEGDFIGSAEPYLWTVFFKIDGQFASVTDAGTLTGFPITLGTPGSHGNLGTTDVDAGDDIPIPSELAFFDTTLVPIRGGILDALGIDLPGTMGVVCVLMEEDNVTDAGAEAGHDVLNSSVLGVLEQIIATRSFSNSTVTDAEIAAFTGQIQTAVEAAVQLQQSFFENLWSFLNADDTIGVKVFTFNTDDLASGGTFQFSERFQNEGDWQIFGHLIATPQCAAASFDAAFSGSLSSTTLAADGAVESRQVIDAGTLRLVDAKEPVAAKREGSVFDLAALREFRDRGLGETPGLERWWGLAERNIPGTVFGLFTQAELREPAFRAMKALPAVVRNPDAQVPEALLDDIAKVAAGLRRTTRSRRLRIDAGRVLSALELVRRKTFRETAALLASIEPGNPRKEPAPAAIRLDGTRIVGGPLEVKAAK